jgi:hypothetical protein
VLAEVLLPPRAGGVRPSAALATKPAAAGSAVHFPGTSSDDKLFDEPGTGR